MDPIFWPYHRVIFILTLCEFCPESQRVLAVLPYVSFAFSSCSYSVKLAMSEQSTHFRHSNKVGIRVIQDILEKCQKAGLRMTSQRMVIAQLIHDSDDHPDVDTIYRRASEIDSSISLATIYRTVAILEEAGVVEKLDIGDGRARYEAAGEHHEHLVDVDTGEIHEFHHLELEALKERIANEMGFELVGHRLELYGRKLSSDTVTNDKKAQD